MRQWYFVAKCFVTLCLLSARANSGEPEVIEIWPGKVIGDHGDIGPERVRKLEESPTPDAKWITNVTRPTISVFHPDPVGNQGVAVVICPGGGYWNLAWDKEGEEVATWLNSLGVTGVVLKYRVPRRPGEPEPLPAPGPLLDAQRAMRVVRSNAKKWNIDPNRIGVMGFSAGGHLAIMTATRFNHPSYEPIDDVDEFSCQPNFAAAAYPGYLLANLEEAKKLEISKEVRIPQGTCPVFLVHAVDDEERGAPPEQSLAMFRALRMAGIPAELHVYASGGHGFGVRRTEHPSSKWTESFADWLKLNGMIR